MVQHLTLLHVQETQGGKERRKEGRQEAFLINIGAVQYLTVTLATLLLQCRHAYLIALYRVSSGKDATLWSLKQLLAEYSRVQLWSWLLTCSVDRRTQCSPCSGHRLYPFLYAWGALVTGFHSFYNTLYRPKWRLLMNCSHYWVQCATSFFENLIKFGLFHHFAAECSRDILIC